MTTARDDLSDAELAALDAWNSVSPDTAGMLFAVREALAFQDRQYARADHDRRVRSADVLDEVADLLRRFDTPADPGRVRAFLGDLTQILARRPR